MNRILLFFAFCILTAPNILSAQEVEVQGKVTSETDLLPLPGVNVVIKGTSVGTITDLNGHYKLTVPQDATLVFSFIGYQNTEIKLDGQTEIDVQLSVKSETLEEAVVVGYATVKKKDLTGSVSILDADKIKSAPVASTDAILQGRTSGVFVASNSGAPGSQLAVRIRGVGTPNNADPLYIVDGMPIKDASFGKHDNPSGINFLNPSDIESINILKDASATAIYGTRGANGVVIITTKKGKAGEMKIDFNSYYGVQQLPKTLDVCNAKEFATLYNEANGETFSEDTIPLLQTTDWQNEIFRLAPTHNVQLSFSGGNEKGTFFMSGNKFSQDGIAKNSSFDRYTVRVNSEYKVKKWFKIGESLTLSQYLNKRQREAGARGAIASALLADPTLPVYNEDGEIQYLFRTTQVQNPVGVNQRRHYHYLTNRIQGTVFAEIQFFKQLKYKLNLGLDRSWGNREEVWPKYYVGPTDASSETKLMTELEKWNNYLIEHTLNFNHTFATNHSVNLLLGYAVQEEVRNKPLLQSSNDYEDEERWWHRLGYNYDIKDRPYEWALISQFCRFNYTFKNKYLLTANVRRDGSSRFGKNERYATFPSMAVAWKINEESFMDNVPVISLLKLRFGYGKVGNQNIEPYAYTATAVYSPTTHPNPSAFFGINKDANPALNLYGAANQDIKWETTKTTNLAVDVSLWDSKLNATIDLYNKTTTDLLLNVPTPLYSAVTFGNSIANAGEVNNKGIDVEMDYHGDFNGLKYNIGFNLSKVKNVVKKLEGGAPLSSAIQSDDISVRMIEDEPIGVFWGYVTEGIFETEQQVEEHATQERKTGIGDLMFKDLNGDGDISPEDQTIIGRALPDLTYGVTLNLSYRIFDLNVFGQGVHGNSLYNQFYMEQLYRYDMTRNVSTDLLNYYGRELEDGSIITNTRIPRLGRDRNNNDRISDFYVEDGSYFRIKTLTLAVNIPSPILQRIHLSNLRIYGTIQNLYTFTKYSGYDPEIGNSPTPGGDTGINYLAFGIDDANYPMPRTFLIGIDLSF